MLIIGLTGGIGSGKTTVAELFAAQGAPIIDADVIAKELLTDNPIFSDALIAHFGSSILEHGKMSRAKLRKLVFDNPDERKWLENLLHPEILMEIKRRIYALSHPPILGQNTPPYCIVVIPLLAEVPESQELVDRILVIDTDEDIQITRIMQRDKLTFNDAKKILASQANRKQRLDIADDSIHNQSDKETLKQQVLMLHQIYKQ